MGCYQIRLRLQALRGHGCNRVKLDHLHLLLSILALRLNNYPALEIDETCKVLLKKNFFRWSINSNDMFVADLAQPRQKLLSISNGCTQCKERAVATLDDSLQGVTFWPVECVNLVKDKVVKLTVTPIKNHELSLTLLHFLSCCTTRLTKALLNSTGSTNVNLRSTRNFLEGDQISGNCDVAAEELIVSGSDLPY